MRIVALGSPNWNPECWHDDVVEAARDLGWDAAYLRAAGTTTDHVLEAARDADLLLWIRAHGHELRGDATWMLRSLEAFGVRTVGLHQDLYWGIPQRERRIGNEPWWTCQRVYTSDGGDRDWAGRGVNHAWCPPAVGTRFLGRAEATTGPPYVFTGSAIWMVHGDHRVRLIRWAKKRWGRDFRWYGVSPQQRVLGARATVAYGAARVVLGDSAPAPFYWSDRVPRVMARGALLAHPRTDGMKEQGLDDSTMLLYDRYDFDGLGRAIDELTDDEVRRRTDAGLELVRSRHLWKHRLESIAREALG